MVSLAAPFSQVSGHLLPSQGRRSQSVTGGSGVSQTSAIAEALISIDQYAFGEDAERKNRWRLRLTERLAHDAQRVRMLGSSAIDLAWTAEGRLDACIQLGNKPWDISAGVLIALEAGARVLDHDGSEHSEQSRSHDRGHANTRSRSHGGGAGYVGRLEPEAAMCCQAVLRISTPGWS